MFIYWPQRHNFGTGEAISANFSTGEVTGAHLAGAIGQGVVFV